MTQQVDVHGDQGASEQTLSQPPREVGVGGRAVQPPSQPAQQPRPRQRQQQSDAQGADRQPEAVVTHIANGVAFRAQVADQRLAEIQQRQQNQQTEQGYHRLVLNRLPPILPRRLPMPVVN